MTIPADRGLNEHDKEANGRRRFGLTSVGREKGWGNARACSELEDEGGAGMLKEEAGVGEGTGDEATTALVEITPAETP